MAGTCEALRETVHHRGIDIITWTWTSDSAGNVSGVGGVNQVFGRIEQLEFLPGTGDNQPTNEYDVVVTDEHGRDVLMGQGIDLSHDADNTAKNIRTPLNGDLGYMTCAGLTLTPGISGAGNKKSGTIRMVVR